MTYNEKPSQTIYLKPEESVSEYWEPNNENMEKACEHCELDERTESKKEQVCSLSLSLSLWFSTPNGRKLQPVKWPKAFIILILVLC